MYWPETVVPTNFFNILDKTVVLFPAIMITGADEKSMLYEAWLTILGKRRGQHRGDSWAVRILSMAFCLLCLIITTSYTANLAALFSTVGLFRPRIVFSLKVMQLPRMNQIFSYPESAPGDIYECDGFSLFIIHHAALVVMQLSSWF